MVDDFDGDAVGAVVLIGFYEVFLGVGKKNSPWAAQNLADADGVENGGDFCSLIIAFSKLPPGEAWAM